MCLEIKTEAATKVLLKENLRVRLLIEQPYWVVYLLLDALQEVSKEDKIKHLCMTVKRHLLGFDEFVSLANFFTEEEMEEKIFEKRKTVGFLFSNLFLEDSFLEPEQYSYVKNETTEFGWGFWRLNEIVEYWNKLIPLVQLYHSEETNLEGIEVNDMILHYESKFEKLWSSIFRGNSKFLLEAYEYFEKDQEEIEKDYQIEKGWSKKEFLGRLKARLSLLGKLDEIEEFTPLKQVKDWKVE